VRQTPAFAHTQVCPPGSDATSQKVGNDKAEGGLATAAANGAPFVFHPVGCDD